MNFNASIAGKVLIVCTFFISWGSAIGQQTPFNPVISRAFTPIIFNPAMTGSKDFATLDLAAVLQGDNMSQVISGNSRIAKKTPRYFNSPSSKDFTNFGVGGTFFHDIIGASNSIGISAAASYQIPLAKNNLSFLSFGAAVKGIYNRMDSIPDLAAPEKISIFPNLDAGIYYYNPTFYVGLSSVNILGNPLDSADMSIYGMPVSRQYFFHAGYKLVISKSYNIVLEPSLTINLDDSLSFEPTEILEPSVKLYLDNFCLGTYIHDFDKLSFFFQYKFPGFYLGTLIDFPRGTPFYKKELTIELGLGINLSRLRSSYFQAWHW